MKASVVLYVLQPSCILQMKCRDSNLSFGTFVPDCQFIFLGLFILSSLKKCPVISVKKMPLETIQDLDR